MGAAYAVSTCPLQDREGGKPAGGLRRMGKPASPRVIYDQCKPRAFWVN